MEQRRFCQYCRNLLEVDILNDQLRFNCMGCNSHYSATDDDSLRFEEVKGSNISIFKKILEKIPEDPLNPKMYKDCKCGGGMAKFVRLGNDMKLVYSCISCGAMTMR